MNVIDERNEFFPIKMMNDRHDNKKKNIFIS